MTCMPWGRSSSRSAELTEANAVPSSLDKIPRERRAKGDRLPIPCVHDASSRFSEERQERLNHTDLAEEIYLVNLSYRIDRW